ncbi:hypothetical protein ACQ4PT_043677 [Festuca glaucescens]
MAPQQQHKTAVVAVFLAALVLALPAAAYRPEAAGSTAAEAGTPVAGGYTPGAAASTPAEATPTEATPTEATPTEAAPTDAAVSTPTEASTPAEETPTEAAVSTPAAAGTSVVAGYTPAAAAGTTPAAESGKATTDVQKLMEMVNGVYKKALEAANAAAPDDKFSVFDAAFTKGIKEGLADRIMDERVMFSTMINRAIKDAYVSTSAINVASEEERFSVFVFTLTEALRVMAATVEAHAVKPAAEEAVAGGAKEPAGDQLVIEKIDAAVKTAAGASKEAPLSDKFLVFEATFSKAFKDEMGPAYDENKAIPQLNAAYKEAYKATVAATPEKRFDAFLNGLTKYIMVIGQAAAKTGAASKPAAEATTEPAAEDATKPAAEAAIKPVAEADVKPAAQAAYKPAAQAAAKPAGGAVGGYNL